MQTDLRPGSQDGSLRGGHADQIGSVCPLIGLRSTPLRLLLIVTRSESRTEVFDLPTETMSAPHKYSTIGK